MIDHDNMTSLGFTIEVHHAHALAKDAAAAERVAIEAQIGTIQFAVEGAGALVALEAEERALAEYDLALERMIAARQMIDALHIIGAEARAPW